MKVLTILGLATLAIVGCSKPSPKAETAKTATLAAGTVIPVLLLRNLHSGRDENERIPLIVRNDVVDGTGNVLIRKGAPVWATVVQSRRADTLSQLSNRPARLAIRFEEALAADGTWIKLSSGVNSAEEFQLTRSNTSIVNQDALPELSPDDLKKLEALSGLFEKDSNEDPRRVLEAMRGNTVSPKLSQAVESGQTDELVKTLEALRRGNLDAIANLAAPSLVVFLEVASEARKVGDRLGRMLSAPNIHAPAGLELTAYAAETRQVAASK